MHVLDRDAERGSAGNVTYGPNGLHDFGKLRARRLDLIVAVLEAKLTWADSTPGTAASAFSIAGGQWAQVMPPMRRLMCSEGRLSGGGVNWLGIHGKWAPC